MRAARTVAGEITAFVHIRGAHLTRISSCCAVVMFCGSMCAAGGSLPAAHPFAPEVISGPLGVDCLSFTPDGNTAVLDEEGKSQSTIAISDRTAGRWSTPHTAMFSGHWVDHDPAIAPDGSYLIFTSNRPDVAGGQAFRGGHLWRVDRAGSGWSAATRLPDVVNFGEHVYAPSIAANGDLFFQSRDNPSHDFKLYRSAWHDGRYLRPEQLQLGPAGRHELDPAIAPDESFIVFDANYAGIGEPDHLYIAFAQRNRWSHPIDLGAALDRYQPWGSHLGPDGHTLYFTSNGPTGSGKNQIWSVDLAPWLRTRPTVFAPGVISGPLADWSAAFAPDGRTVYFVRGDQNPMLMESDLKAGKWSAPQPAPFSGHWHDLDPAMAPDGSYLLFVSNRPVDPHGKPLDLVNQGKVYPGGGMNIWRVDRKGAGWSMPVRLPPIINTSPFTFAPNIAADDSLYFIGQTSDGQRRLLVARYREGHYQQPQQVALGAPGDWIRDPAIAPDQSFIVFSIIPAGSSEQVPRLAIAFRHDAAWSRPIDLGDTVNGDGGAMGSQLGPDHRTLYFYSNRKLAGESAASWNNGKANIWRVSLAPWLESHRGSADNGRSN